MKTLPIILLTLLVLLSIMSPQAQAAINKLPIAHAGADLTVNEQTPVTLDGTASTATDSTISRYQWTQAAGKPLVILTNATTASATFTAPLTVKATKLSFKLTITDSNGKVARDTVVVTVKPVNTAPIADAGSDRNVGNGVVATLDGSQSLDSDGSIKHYRWQQTAGPPVKITAAKSVTATFIIPSRLTAPLALVFKLTVTDNEKAQASDTVTYTLPFNQVPTKPQLIGVSSTTGNSITVEWMPAQDDLTRHAKLLYTLHVSDTQGFEPSAATEQIRQMGIVNATVNSLQPGTLYYVKVTATDEQGFQAWSNELSITTVSIIAHTTPATVKIQQASQAPKVTATTVTYSNSAAPKVGDFIASAEGGSYFRKVIGVQKRAPKVVATTADASLNEVFDSLEINSTLKLDGVGDSVQAAKGLTQKTVRSTSPPGSSQTTLVWRQTGLTLTDPNIGMGSAPAMQATRPGAANIIINNDEQTLKGRYVDVTGPAFVGFRPGELGKIDLSAHIARAKPDEPLQICSLKLISFTHKEASKRAIIAQDQATGDGLQIAATLLGDMEQTATLKGVWQVQGKYVHDGGVPYNARFEVIVDEKKDGCAKIWTNAWAESQEIDIPIYVTMGNLPSIETKPLNYSGDFSVNTRNTFSAQPTFDIAARIEYAQLQQATLAVNADFAFLQDLQIVANGTGKLDQTLELLAPRKFVKVLVAGGIPIVVSGEFAMTLRVQGHATGTLNLGETLKYAYPNARFGLQYQLGEWHEINEFTPDYQFTVNGSGEAGADLTLTLIPDLKIQFYDVVSERMLLLPSLYTKANIHGQFQNTQSNFLTDLDYWFTDLQGGGGLDLKRYAGLHILDYNLASYPAQATINDPDPFKCLTIMGKSGLGSDCAADNSIVFAGIPDLGVAADVTAFSPQQQNSCALSIQADYKNIANPFKTLFAVGPEAFINFKQWDEPKIITDQANASITPANDREGHYWFHYKYPGTYELRVTANTDLGWFIRALALPQPFIVTLTDNDTDGMVDQWETLWGVSNPDADQDRDGISNLQEFQACTLPNVNSRLNDTGIIACANLNTNDLSCPVADFPNQDAEIGRDVTHNDDTDGHAGFSFTKISANGVKLPESANTWNCVLDNVTGLMWEIKNTELGLHNQINTYTWDRPDYNQHWPRVGYCKGSECYVHAFVQAVNVAGYCGYHDWRLPTREELQGIVSYDRFDPVIDTRFFPNTPSGWYWTSSQYAKQSDEVWIITFFYGLTQPAGKYLINSVRLVR